MQYGTDAYKLHRTHAPETSVEAAYSADTSKLEGQVHAAIAAFGGRGCIQDEVIARFPAATPYSSITARFRSLLDKKMVHETGEKRPGRSGRNQRVLVNGPE